jgi:lipopolysaccharide/colanic/teichoic acid biosynthesis glycosyltransferase
MLATLASLPKRTVYPTFKRLFDIILSCFALIILSPLFMFIAAAIRCDSSGPILYRQNRVSRGCRLFVCYKFRTMYIGSDDGGITTANKKAMISSVGKVLRHYKIDELPQLFNVLKGDMSLVGPRPTVQRYVSIYPELYSKILQLKPGMTGLASIKLYQKEEKMLANEKNGEHAYTHKILPMKLLLNLFYVRKRSLGFDMLILYWTIVHLLSLFIKPIFNKR